jgi:hypothetical protein
MSHSRNLPAPDEANNRDWLDSVTALIEEPLTPCSAWINSLVSTPSRTRSASDNTQNLARHISSLNNLSEDFLPPLEDPFSSARPVLSPPSSLFLSSMSNVGPSTSASISRMLTPTAETNSDSAVPSSSAPSKKFSAKRKHQKVSQEIESKEKHKTEKRRLSAEQYRARQKANVDSLKKSNLELKEENKALKKENQTLKTQILNRSTLFSPAPEQKMDGATPLSTNISRPSLRKHK